MKAVEKLDDLIFAKTGSDILFRKDKGFERLDHRSFKRIGEQAMGLRAAGNHVSLISSGAVTAGMEVTKTRVRPTGEEEMPELQRLASLGWHRVVTAWGVAMPEVHVGGFLVTSHDIDPETPEHDEVLRTLWTLLCHGDVPVLNENDIAAHKELSKEPFGQNDTLSATLAAQVAGSEYFGRNIRLVLLSDVDGVMEDMRFPDTVIPEISVSHIEEFEHLVDDSRNRNGSGGMKTKFDAAKIALGANVEMYVANGREPNAIQRALNGEIGTRFIS